MILKKKNILLIIIIIYLLILIRNFLFSFPNYGDLLGHFYKSYWFYNNLSFWNSSWYGGIVLFRYYPLLSYLFLLPFIPLGLIGLKFVIPTLFVLNFFSMYYSVKLLFKNKTIAIFASLFYISSFWFLFISISSGSLPHLFSTLFFPLAIAFSIKALDNRKYIYKASLFVILTFLTHHTAGMMVYSSLILIFFIRILKDKKFNKNLFLIFLYSTIGSLLFLGPLILRFGYSAFINNAVYVKAYSKDLFKVIKYIGYLPVLLCLYGLRYKFKNKLFFYSLFFITICIGLGTNFPFYYFNPIWKNGIIFNRIFDLGIYSASIISAFVLFKINKKSLYIAGIVYLIIISIFVNPIYSINKEERLNDFLNYTKWMKSQEGDFRIREHFFKLKSINGASPYFHGKDILDGWYIEGTSMRYNLVSMDFFNKDPDYVNQLYKFSNIKYIVAFKEDAHNIEKLDYTKIKNFGDINVYKSKFNNSFYFVFSDIIKIKKEKEKRDFKFQDIILDVKFPTGILYNERYYDLFSKGLIFVYDKNVVNENAFDTNKKNVLVPNVDVQILGKKNKKIILKINNTNNKKNYIMLSQNYYPGWTVSDKVIKLYESSLGFVVLEIPPNYEGEVIYYYKDNLSLYFGLITIVILLFLMYKIVRNRLNT